MGFRRLGCLTTTAVIVGIIAALMIAASALASGGTMYSPGDLNAEQGDVLGGVSSHAEIAGNCSACHAAPWEADTMDDRCSLCHVNVADEMKTPTSVHGRMMQIDPEASCRTCHPEHRGSEALLTVLEGWRFPHDVSRFKLDGHLLTAAKEPFLCADCHGEDVTQFDALTCRKCHIQMDMAFMVEHQVTFGENCLECHDGVDRFGDDFDHNLFAFKLNGQHASVKCSQCHVAATSVVALQATRQDCFACHAKDDTHGGSLGPDCAACHSVDGWKPSHFDHNRSLFKLSGAHAQVTCEQCHVNGLFKGTPMDCFSCHQQNDAHQGQLGSTCEKCHTTDAWKPACFDHNTTTFPLTGSHMSAECKACHVTGVYKGTPRQCFSCHSMDDAHKGQFGRNCGFCHQTTKWSGARFDHNLTAFPLIGNHVKLNCSSCHKNDVFRGTPKNCFSCHAKDDRHNGQLGQDCAVCHTPTGWKTITFDHNTSAFPLTGKHSMLDCSQCHLAGRFKISTECSACHQEPTFHAGGLGTNCTQCHTTSGWLPANFTGSHPVALGQNFLDHHEATCKTCHTTTVHEFTCLACHETNPLSPEDTPVPTSTPVAKEPAVGTSPVSSNLQMGDTSALTVSLNNVPAEGYTSTEFTCTYDPLFVEVSNIHVQELFGPDAVSTLFGPKNGSFILAAAGSNGRKVLNDGSAFTFDVQALQMGTTAIECTARVSEGLNALTSITPFSSTISIAGVTPTATQAPASASVSGQVLASKLVTVRLYNAQNSVVATTTCNPDGTFTLNAPAGTYTIVASADGFLDVQGQIDLVSGSNSVTAVVSLLPGDLDRNGVIDQMDALTIRMNYNNSMPTVADLNNDGVINVLDLGILAENYGRSGPLPWP